MRQCRKSQVKHLVRQNPIMVQVGHFRVTSETNLNCRVAVCYAITNGLISASLNVES